MAATATRSAAAESVCLIRASGGAQCRTGEQLCGRVRSVEEGQATALAATRTGEVGRSTAAPGLTSTEATRVAGALAQTGPVAPCAAVVGSRNGRPRRSRVCHQGGRLTACQTLRGL